MAQEHKSHGSNQQVTPPARFVKKFSGIYLQEIFDIGLAK